LRITPLFAVLIAFGICVNQATAAADGRHGSLTKAIDQTDLAKRARRSVSTTPAASQGKKPAVSFGEHDHEALEVSSSIGAEKKKLDPLPDFQFQNRCVAMRCHAVPCDAVLCSRFAPQSQC
jgi:hypothetical protein